MLCEINQSDLKYGLTCLCNVAFSNNCEFIAAPLTCLVTAISVK